MAQHGKARQDPTRSPAAKRATRERRAARKAKAARR
jgi:hypothetical protein